MNTNFVIMGLPASGKTTFLAALWHLVEAGEMSCGLKLERYEGDLAYLNRIAEAWRTFKKVPRTSQVGDQDVVIHLIGAEDGRQATAFFPDLAGETFDGQVEGRRCRPTFVEGIEEDDGILFFIAADRKEDDLSIVELNKRLPMDALPVGPALEPQGKAAGDEERANPLEWDPKTIPTQVRIVQLLTDLLWPPFASRRRRLAVIVSAWDLVDDLGLNPSDWVKAHMPLLAQFLATNGDAFDHVVFGVSAQGVSLDDEGAINRAALLTPSRRIRVVGPEVEGHDLTLPLIWLISDR
jgi:hypothetical protein